MPENVRPVKIEDEMRGSYLDYAMSVIVSRALPDVRDGLKPVHRRILYSMSEMGIRPGTPYRKSARIVGDVLGKYHPHGDSAVYDAMVRMAQDFAMRYPLIDGQGNFGSVDGDPPAAMRYTEARLASIAEEILADIDKNTVDFTSNFDDSLREPMVLPSRLPNLLINGTAGIAVGMATNIPPHNLGEVCDALVHLIDNPDATNEELGKLVKGPDFPTRGLILGKEGIVSAYATGHGRIVIRAKAHIEESARTGRHQIIVTELPYQVNKAHLIEKIADMVKEKRIDTIAELRDESDRSGMRILIELKKDANPRQALAFLYKHTQMQTAFSANMLALVNGQPRVLTLKGLLTNFLAHRRDVVTRRTQFELDKARERAHILEGLKIALDNLDAVIQTIRAAASAEAAKATLIERFALSDIQAQAILDMQLRRLAALERQKILDEYAELLKTIAELEDLLANPKKMDFVIAEEIGELRSKSGERRTQISDDASGDIADEDLVPDQDVAVTISQRGSIKRVPADTYRVQKKGGKGVIGAPTREEDAVQQLVVCNTRDKLLMFTTRGRVFCLPCHEIPDASRTAKGMAVINLIPVEGDERVNAMIAVTDFEMADYLVMVTRLGEIKKSKLSLFANVRSTGIIAMDLPEGDRFISAKLVDRDQDVLLVTEHGQAIRFNEVELRDASRTSGGVRGIKLLNGDGVVSLDAVDANMHVLTISELGYGKRTAVSEYPVHGRGGQGVKGMNVTDKTGPVVASQIVFPGQGLMLVSEQGIVIRTDVDSIQAYGRATQGVRVMDIASGDRVSSIACFFDRDPQQQLSMLESMAGVEVAPGGGEGS
jgi:DNA gyrase subunit A